MGRGDRRLLVGALCGISVTLAAALLLGQPHASVAVWSRELALLYWPHVRHLLARKNCATAIQSLGALITFYGLGQAYIRAKHNETVEAWAKRSIKRIWRTLLRRPRQATTHSGTAHGTFGFHGYAVGYVTHNVDITLSLHEQIKRLAQFVNSRSREAAQMESTIADLQQEFRQARDATSELERKTLAHIETQIQQLSGAAAVYPGPPECKRQPANLSPDQRNSRRIVHGSPSRYTGIWLVSSR